MFLTFWPHFGSKIFLKLIESAHNEFKHKFQLLLFVSESIKRLEIGKIMSSLMTAREIWGRVLNIYCAILL